VKREISSSMGLAELLIEAEIKGAIFNPGSENSDVADKLRKNDIKVYEECTLIGLSRHG